MKLRSLLPATLLLISATFATAAKPLKIFILAGQSNMEGHAKVETFDYIGDDPATAPLLKQMRTADGKFAVCDHVWISYLTGAGNTNGEGLGKLTAGYGSRQDPAKDGGKIGPEFTFGLTLDKALQEPVLIIKTAWGGKSLYHDFRSPSSGVYPRTARDVEKGENLEAQSGQYYRSMVDHVKRVLSDIKRVCPVYDEKQGYEIAGFAWLQGWNDMVSRDVYPIPKQGDATPRYAEYSRLLANFIRDVRKDVGAPRMPFVIGVMGVGGSKPNEHVAAFREAMAAPAALPEFKGNVTAVQTASFWSEELGAIADKHDEVRQMGYYLKTKSAKHANADGAMNEQQQRDYLKQFEAKLISPAEETLWKRGASNAGYHYLGCAKTFALMGKAFAEALLKPGSPTAAAPDPPSIPKPALAPNPVQRTVAAAPTKAEMAGYMLVPTEKVPPEYNAGFSLYVAAFSLLEQYPGHRFQTGLFGTWMHAQFEGKPPADLYSDIEGGLGWWRDTRFPTVTPKFIMGGVAVNFKEIANGPAHGRGTWEEPKGLYGVAQLTPWLLFPIDGLNIKQGTRGELFGYGYLPLPLTSPKATTAGKNIPTGDNSWTLFLNTKNFKGPVCFFTPYFWSRSAVVNPAVAGLLLDSRPSDPNKPFQMETQYVPAAVAQDAKGDTYARVAPTIFPAGADGSTVVMHQLTSYRKLALWEGVKGWLSGGAEVSGKIQPEGAFIQKFKSGGGSTWKIYPEGTPKEGKTPIDWKAFATPYSPDPTTYGYQWDANRVKKSISPDGFAKVTLPEYYRLVPEGSKSLWIATDAIEVPSDTGLKNTAFSRPKEKPPEPYDTPETPGSSFKSPGPAAGPFEARLGDGSVVTYSWYRFADQPALLNADLTQEEREAMQGKVEKLHRAWTKDRDYLAPPTVGKLADLDPAQIVTPPKGLEIGYVPIATRQELDTAVSESK